MPGIGRWQGRDPIGDVSFAKSHARYALLYMPIYARGLGSDYDFVRNIPSCLIDPFGLCSTGCKDSFMQTSIDAGFDIGVVEISFSYTRSEKRHICSKDCGNCRCGSDAEITVQNSGSMGGSIPTPLWGFAITYGVEVAGLRTTKYDTCAGTSTTSHECKTITLTIGAEECIKIPPVVKICLVAKGGLEIKQCDGEPETHEGNLSIVLQTCLWHGCSEAPLYPKP